MDFRELQYIITIAKHASVTKASEELFISQPTLSKFVQKFESELGQHIFRRNGNKFLLTYAGEVYVRQAKRILELKKELDQELRDIIHDNRGELRVAFPVMRGTYMLPRVLPRFKQLYPNVRVIINEDNSTKLDSALLNGDVDIAFYNLLAENPKLDYTLISQEEIVIVAPIDTPLWQYAHRRSDCGYPWIPIERVEEHLCLLTTKYQRTRQIVNAVFAENHISPPRQMEVSNIFASIQLASLGYGIAFTSESHLKNTHLERQPACFSFGSPRVSVRLVAAARKGMYLPKFAQDFIETVRRSA